MRVVLMLILGVLISVSLLAQESGLVVPKAVKNRMLAKFPQTQDVPVAWTKEGTNYKGSLTIMDKPAFALIDETGKIIRLERTIHYSYLPKKISDQLSKLYPGYEVLDVFEVTDAVGAKTYKTTFQYKQTLVFDAEGVSAK